MHRLFAGVALLTLALTACGGASIEEPPPHIVALGVPTTVAPKVDTAMPAPVVVDAVARVSRTETVRVAVVTPTTDVWTRLAHCESNGNPKAVGGRGKFFGAFQFTLQTWHGMGMTGNPVEYSYADQLAVAQRLQARSGWRNWPVCARRVVRA